MWLFKEHPMGDASHACCLRADTIAPQSSLECGRDTTGLAAAWGHKDLTDYRAQWLSRQVKLYQCRGLPPGPSGICAIIELNGQLCAIFKVIAQSFPPGIQVQLLSASLKATTRHETKEGELPHTRQTRTIESRTHRKLTKVGDHYGVDYELTFNYVNTRIPLRF